MKTIYLTKKTFNKASKILLKKLQECPEQELSLSRIQEYLSNSFGFRNNDSLNTFFSSESQTATPKKEINLLKNFSSNNITLIFDSLMPADDSLWRGRAISLISAITMALVYMRDQKEILLDVDAIREHLILDNIIKLYKQRTDFPNHIRAALRAYLVSLPGFQESAPKQNDTVMEQHGYLQMQFTKIFHELSYIEKNNDTILRRKWFLPLENIEGGYIAKAEIEKLPEYIESWISDKHNAPVIDYLLYKKENVQILDLFTFLTTTTSAQSEQIIISVIRQILKKPAIFSIQAKKFDSLVFN